MVDAPDLGSGARKGVGVRVPPFAHTKAVNRVKTNVVEKGKWERELEVEVPAERIDGEVDKAYKKYQKSIQVPGFRKGKVPLKIIKSRYGASIRGDVISDLLPRLVEEATRESGLTPAAPPTIQKLDHNPGESLTFTASLDIWPDVQVENVEGLKATKMVHEVGDDEVEQQLQELQNQHATETSGSGPLEKENVLIADLQKLDTTGVPIVGEKYEERYFVIGSENAPSPEFEEALIGISVGEQRRVKFSYRDDFPNEELAGKEEFFEVTAKQIRTRTLPELDDDFAKDLGEQFESLENLRQHLHKQLKQRWDTMSRQQLRSSLTEELIKANALELPERMVDNYLRTLQRERAEREGHSHDHHHHHDHDHDHDHDDGDEEKGTASAEERASAIRQLKSYLLVDAVRESAGVAVADEEFEEFLSARAEDSGMKVEELRRSKWGNNLRKELEENKVFDYLIERAEIEEQSV